VNFTSIRQAFAKAKDTITTAFQHSEDELHTILHPVEVAIEETEAQFEVKEKALAADVRAAATAGLKAVQAKLPTLTDELVAEAAQFVETALEQHGL
jgi:mRNA-degrading endonuclease toxin of MazEF toxin-antitoxin module